MRQAASGATPDLGARTAVTFMASGVNRLLLFVAFGSATLLVLQVARLLAEAAGLCTGCNVGTEGGDALAVTAAGGVAAAWALGYTPAFVEDYYDRTASNLPGREPEPPGPLTMPPPLPEDRGLRQSLEVRSIRRLGEVPDDLGDAKDWLLNLAESDGGSTDEREPGPEDVPEQ